MLSRARPPGIMLRGCYHNYNFARLVPAIGSSSRNPITTPYQSLFHPHRLSAATVASYSTAHTPTPIPPPTKRLPSAGTSTSTNTRTSTTTSATTISKPLTDKTVVQSHSFPDSLNPPTSTLPPPLNLPPPKQPEQSLFSYYYALGKAYATFYKTGIRIIYHNWKWTRQLRGRIAALPSSKMRQSDDEALLRSGALTRAEFLLLRRTGQDVRKIPPFALMFILCGEFTPLVVITLNGMVPRTLWIPKQVLRAREKAESRRAAVYAATTKSQSKPETIMTTEKEVRRLGQILGAYPAWWDHLPITPSWFISRRVAERLRLIDLDDFAIERDDSRDDSAQRLDELQEVQLAAEMRGLNVLGRSDEELKAMLGKWLLARKRGSSVEEMVLEGPGGWAGR